MVRDEGLNNVVEISPGEGEIKNVSVTFRGDNNHVRLDAPVRRLDGLQIDLGSNCKVHIGAYCILGRMFIYGESMASLSIDEWTSVNGTIRILMHEASSVSIGRDCLFGGGVEITTSDMHSIIDLETKQRINPPKDVLIGDHVWVGQSCHILKGAVIGQNSVIGAGAVVTGRLPESSVFAGVPARMIRSGVTWTHGL